MKLLIVPLVFAFNMYLINFARYQWADNKLGSIGSIFLVIMAVVLPIILILIR
jgi:hypothetical protein